MHRLATTASARAEDDPAGQRSTNKSHRASFSGIAGPTRRNALSCALVLVVACASEVRTTSRGQGARQASAGAAAVGPQTAGDTAPILSGPVPDRAAAGSGVRMTRPNCDPGAYVGSYECKLVRESEQTEVTIDGVVSFDLEINAAAAKGTCAPGQEFCDFDLVITEGSGKLFGFALGVIGFETGLKGGLDCATGDFHAQAVGGIWGVPWPDPNDPEGKLKVAVELGTFDGSLDGKHGGTAPQTIAGLWNLGEPTYDIYCPGPFSVALTP